jgi:hypothetical protein
MTLCIECGQEEISKFKGYAKYKLCKDCGIARGKRRREQEDQPWKDERKAKEERKQMRRQLAMEEVSPGTFEKLRGLTNKSKRKSTRSRKRDDYKWIPPHMLWCALNPTLTIPQDLMTEEDEQEEREYIEGPGGKPPPLSRNLYKMIKGNPKALDRFVGKIDTLYSQHIKKQENTDREEDSKLIDDIWKIVGEAIPLTGIMQKARRDGHLPERRVNKK